MRCLLPAWALCLNACMAQAQPRQAYYPLAGLGLETAYTQALETQSSPPAVLEGLTAGPTELLFRTFALGIPPQGELPQPDPARTAEAELRERGVPLAKTRLSSGRSGPPVLVLHDQSDTRNPDGSRLFRLTVPEGRLWAVTGYPARQGREGAVLLQVFWQYGSSQAHAATLFIEPGAGLLPLSQTGGVVVKNNAFGISFRTAGPKAWRYLTYWLDSGSFTANRKVLDSAKKPARVLAPQEVEEVQPVP